MAYDVKVIESFIRQEAVKRHMNPRHCRPVAKKGFKGLEDAIGKGLLPAAAIGIFLPYLGGGEEKERADAYLQRSRSRDRTDRPAAGRNRP